MVVRCSLIWLLDPRGAEGGSGGQRERGGVQSEGITAITTLAVCQDHTTDSSHATVVMPNVSVAGFVVSFGGWIDACWCQDLYVGFNVVDPVVTTGWYTSQTTASATRTALIRILIPLAIISSFCNTFSFLCVFCSRLLVSVCVLVEIVHLVVSSCMCVVVVVVVGGGGAVGVGTERQNCCSRRRTTLVLSTCGLSDVYLPRSLSLTSVVSLQ